MGRADFFVAMEEEADGASRGLMYVGHLKNFFDLTSDSSLEVGGDHVNVSAISTGKVSRTMGDVHLLGNPHYRRDPYHGRIIARNIARRLKQLDAEHSADYDRDLTALR